MNSFLVTGAFGLIGRATIKELLARGEKVVAFDIAPRPDVLPENEFKKIVTVKGDITEIIDIVRTIKKEKIDHIIHLAAIHQIRTCRQYPMLTYRVNVEGTMNVLEAARLMEIDKVVFPSSVSVYQEGASSPITEDYPKNPKTVYGAMKLAGEQIGLSYSNEQGLDFVALRFPGVYGHGSMSTRGPMRTILQKCLEGEPAVVRGPSPDSNPYNLLYSKDAAQALYLASYAKDLKHRVFNINSGEQPKLDDIIQIAKKLVPNAKLKKELYVSRGLAFDISRAREELNYEPAYNLEKGFKDYLNEFQMHKERIKLRKEVKQI